MAITLLTPSIHAHLLEQWFISTFPKFGGLREEPDYPIEGAQALQSAMVSYAASVGSGKLTRGENSPGARSPPPVITRTTDHSFLQLALRLPRCSDITGQWSRILPF
jgi:hypothetical protein